MTAELLVDSCGEIRRLDAEETLTFGRDADLVIDTNMHLHRRLGKFHYAGLWRLTNVGSATRLEIADKHSPSRTVLAPGATTTIDHQHSFVRFTAGRSSYELEVAVLDDAARVPQIDDSPVDSPATITPASLGIELTDDQIRLLVALSWHQLHEPSSRDIPSNRQAAALLGWKLTRFNRKVDSVAQRFARLELVGGLHGELADKADDRRQRLVTYALDHKIISPTDLHLIPDDTLRP